MNTKKIFSLLGSTDKRNAIFLLVLTIIMALMDVTGVASILPFIAVLTNPDLIDTNNILSNMFQTLSLYGVKNKEDFIYILGIVVFAIFVFSLIFKIFVSYFQIKFIEIQEYKISKRLIENFLHQPYEWFLSRNTNELKKGILSEVQQVINNGFKPLFEVITKGLVAIFIILLLISINFKLSFVIVFFLLIIYTFIFQLLRKYLSQNGKKLLKNNKLRFIAVSEAFGSIKEIKTRGLENFFTTLYSNSAIKFTKSNIFSNIAFQLPRHIIEMISFGGILLILLFLIKIKGNFNNALPVLSLYVFAGYRLMPALQSIYVSISQLTFVGPSLNKLHDNFVKLKQFNQKKKIPLPFNKSITLKKIYYNYPNALKTSLKNINLTIRAKSRVGLIGITGSGKTTVVDIILGLLVPQKGTLEIDGKVITKQNIKSWQCSIGYVPQHIYLSDDTIAANIAFGIDAKNIKLETVKKVSKIAQLHEFIKNELPNKYQTIIGERGIRLSGGQRQRIGIARALYHNPRLLIFDEATSALDNATELAVMNAINNISKDSTIIVIAHRLNTVKNFDIIFKLNQGKLVEQGTFDKIISIKKKYKFLG